MLYLRRIPHTRYPVGRLYHAVDIAFAPAATGFSPYYVAFADSLALLVFDLGGWHDVLFLAICR